MPPNSLSYRETKDRIVISRLHWLKFIVDKGFLLSTNITIHLRLFGLVAIPTGSTRVNSLRERTLLCRCCEKPRISVDADDQILQVRVYNLEKGNMKEEEEEEEEEEGEEGEGKGSQRAPKKWRTLLVLTFAGVVGVVVDKWSTNVLSFLF